VKILFDQNLSPQLVGILAAEFPGSTHVIAQSLDATSDAAIWSFSRTNGFVIASKDTDFKLRAASLGHPPKVIWIRLGNCPTLRVADLLQDRSNDIIAFETDPSRNVLELP